MAIGILSQLQTLSYQDYPLPLTKESSNIAPQVTHSERVSISDGGREALSVEIRYTGETQGKQNIDEVKGRDGQVQLGLIALGKSAINEWTSKGLNLDEKSIIAAGEEFQKAFREILKENGSSTAGSSIALNRHQIVINSQSVPDWFAKEYTNTLSSMEDSGLKNAFENGDTYYISKRLTSNTDALNRYDIVKRSV